jgi:hypothetical protein
MMDPNMPKWIFASICKFFKEEADLLSLPYFAEGADDPSSEVYQQTNLSSRVDGPLITEYSGSTSYRVDIQGLLTEIGKRRNGYQLHDEAGVIAEAMRGGIPVYQIPEAPEQVVGCLLPDPRSMESVRIVNLGVLSTSSKIRQISVVGKFYIEN